MTRNADWIRQEPGRIHHPHDETIAALALGPEGYVGWYDGQVESFFPMDAGDIYSDLVELAGGATPVAERARAVLDEGDPVRALRLSQAAIQVNPESVDALDVRSDALLRLIESADSFLERHWLEAELSRVREVLRAVRAGGGP